MLSAKNINKKYGEREILKDASLEIPEGQIVGIFGDSGIGKSTFAKIICGAEFADSGEYTRPGTRSARVLVVSSVTVNLPLSELRITVMLSNSTP